MVASLRRATADDSPLKGNLPAFKSARAVDPMTVDIELNSRYPLLLNDLTNIFVFSKPWLVANHTEAATDVGRKVEGYATNHTNGTGPFRLESRAADSRTVLLRNPDWWDTPRHNLDRIEFTPINSDATRIAALISGEIDFTNAIPLQATARVESEPKVKLLLATELRTVFFALNYSDTLHERRAEPAARQAGAAGDVSGDRHRADAPRGDAQPVSHHRRAGRARDPRLPAGAGPAACPTTRRRRKRCWPRPACRKAPR